MRCEEVNEYMQRDLDHDLNDEEQRKLMDHMAFCEECTAMYERLKKLSGELEQLPDVKPAYSIVDAIIPQLNKLDGHSASSASNEGRGILSFLRGQRFNWKWISGTVAAGLIMAIWVANAPFNNSKDSASEVQRSNGAQPASDAQQFKANEQAMQKAGEAPSQSENIQMPAAESKQGFAGSMMQDSSAIESAESARSFNAEDHANPADAADSANTLMTPKAPFSNEENAETLFVPVQSQSPTGQFTAMAEQLETGVKQIVIRDQQGQPIFISHQFSQELNVSYEWLGDEVLIYHLILQGQDTGQSETWEIYLHDHGAASYERKQP